MSEGPDPRSPGSRRLRFVTYNVHACVGTDGEFSPTRILRVLEDLRADFIGIQELEDRHFGHERVSEYLARSLGMRAVRGATLRRGNAHYGNLLLSRETATATGMHDMSIPGREPRGLIEAQYELAGRRVRVLVAHFGLRAMERRKQVDRLAAIAGDNRPDLDVLLGDFNEWRPLSYTWRVLSKHFGRVLRRRSWPSRQPVLALDGICVAPAAFELRHRVVGTRTARAASDHLPVICDIFLTQPAIPAGQTAGMPKP